MSLKPIGMGLIAALVVALVAYWALVLRHPAEKQDQALPAAARAPQAAISGNYAEDWQSRCGPLTGASQTDCTSSLDAAYGRKAEAPVPPSTQH